MGIQFLNVTFIFRFLHAPGANIHLEGLAQQFEVL